LIEQISQSYFANDDNISFLSFSFSKVTITAGWVYVPDISNLAAPNPALLQVTLRTTWKNTAEQV
jgi:hypothetical protein